MKNRISIPNILTYFRMLLIPAFMLSFFLIKDDPNYVAVAIFVVAILTDALDGFIARKFKMITDLGKVLDPLADKLLKIATLTCFVIAGVVPVWIMISLLVLDLVLIFSASILLKREIIIKSNYLGKAGTIIIFSGLLLAFFSSHVNNLHIYFLIVGLVVVLFSIFSYLLIYNKIKDTDVK